MSNQNNTGEQVAVVKSKPKRLFRTLLIMAAFLVVSIILSPVIAMTQEWLYYLYANAFGLTLLYVVYRSNLGKTPRVALTIATVLMFLFFTTIMFFGIYFNNKVKVTITEPKNNDTIQADKVTIKGNVFPLDAKVKVGNVTELEVNKGQFEFEAPLKEGKNEFAFNGINTFNPQEFDTAKIIVSRIPTDEEKVEAEKRAAEEIAKKQAEEDVQKKAEEVNSQPTNPVDKIQSIVKDISDMEVSVWDNKQNFAKSTTPPPYEVIVNAGPGKIASCYYAKNIAFEVMQKLYGNGEVKDKLSRVIFTSWRHLRVSVGSDDGTKTDWTFTGPTNFWTVMMKYKPYEDETGPFSQRTWGKYIDSDCY